MTTVHTVPRTARADSPVVPSFAVIPGSQVKEVLQGREKTVVEVVEATYRLHGAGRTVNPPSSFLRFPDRPRSRIIALPASLGGEGGVDGLKWISSCPANVASGIPRASAVLILNDPVTGYPFACMESSIISAARTAASAASAADRLSRGRPRPARLGFVGAGLIARYIHTYLEGTGWSFDAIGVHDLSADSAAGFRTYLEQSGAVGRVTVHRSAEELIRLSDLIVFATVADRPHITEPSWFRAQPGGPARVAARPRTGGAARRHQRRRRHRPLPQGRHLTAPHRTPHRQPRLPARHARRRDGRPCRRSRPAGRRSSHRSAWACWTSRSAATSTTRWPDPANCGSSTTSFTN